MTPTLAMTVEREAKIAAFVPETFYTLQLTFSRFTATSGRFQNLEKVQALKLACEKELNALIKAIERKEKIENPPPLYDLTSLQRDANRVHGFTAQQTLDYTQSLYEKQFVTYPRTDSRYLTDDMEDALPELMEEVGAILNMPTEAPARTEAVINSQKVTDHHAIIPTRTLQKCNFSELPQGEFAILQMIAVRLLVAASAPYRYAETTIQTECAGEIFTSKGRTVLDEGWRGVEKALLPELYADRTAAEEISDAAEGAAQPIARVEIRKGQTSPPKHYTEDTLLAAMETAGAEEMPEEAERHGIGTPATRAGIIEKLVQKGFVERTGSGKAKALMPTEKGKALITVMPEQIQSPAMTAEWEEKLLRVERGELEPEEFMQEINEMIASLVETGEAVKGAEILMPKKIVVGTCPHCGAEVLERQKGWICSNRECRFVLWKDNAYFKRLGKNLTGQMVDKLLRDGRIRLKDCKSAKTGKTYNATALLTTAADGKAVFELEFEKGGERK
jgi:DNA topoisomerase-3